MSPRSVESWTDILIPPIVAGLFPVWSEGRVIRRGRPLSVFLRESLLYATFFVLAMLYSMAAVKIFWWPLPLGIVLTAACAVLLRWIGWSQHKLEHETWQASPRYKKAASLRASLEMAY